MSAQPPANAAEMQRHPRRARGTVLVASYLLLSVFLVYTNMLGLRTLSEQRVVDQLHDSAQALNLARGAAEQVREELHYFLSNVINAQVVSNNTVEALEWLDDLGAGNENPDFDVPMGDLTGDGLITVADGDGQPDARQESPSCLAGLPEIRAGDCAGTDQPVARPRAWIASICALDPQGEAYESCKPPGTDRLAPREITVEAEARVGAVSKRVRAVYEVRMGVSNIFQYAYFINNYGWINAPSSTSMWMHGEARSNGNLTFSGNGSIGVNGDLYASENPDVGDPVAGTPTSAGTITGDPDEDSGMELWRYKRDWFYRGDGGKARPTRRLTFDGQPAIGGVSKVLPLGYGYDSEHPDPANPDQR